MAKHHEKKHSPQAPDFTHEELMEAVPVGEATEAQPSAVDVAQPPSTAPRGPGSVATPAPVESTDFAQWEVSIPGVRVLISDPETGHQDLHNVLNVWARSQWEALQTFAEYNGIPVITEVLTQQPKLDTQQPTKAVKLDSVDLKRFCYCKKALRDDLDAQLRTGHATEIG